MADNTAKKVVDIKPDGTKKGGKKKLISELEKHRSKEFVFAVVGYAGSGTSDVVFQLKTLLRKDKYGLEPHLITAREIIEDYALKIRVSRPTNPSEVENTTFLQDIGDRLRSESDEFGAVAAHMIHRIKLKRDKNTDKNNVYILDSLKHPQEIALLRHLYGDNFCLIGVGCIPKLRKARLKFKFKIDNEESSELDDFINRDSEDSTNNFGQHVNDTFHLSDYFVDNSIDHLSSPELYKLPEQLERFTSLIYEEKKHHPIMDERGMYFAHAAALKSSCLSRQVGAAIIDQHGNLLSIGTNDVPKFGGGLYSDDDKLDDRCFKRKCCSNTKTQIEIIHEVYEKLNQKKLLVGAASYEDFEAVLRKTKVKDSIEYSRSIHAEMDALLSLIRKNTPLPKGSTLYCTTYPCHNCARHIVAAGVDRVVYLEPYSKSLAIDLHHDSIADNLSEKDSEGKVRFEPYQGVSPRLYKQLYLKRGELKDADGNMLPAKDLERHKGSLWKKSYLEFESQVVSFVEAAGSQTGEN